MAAGAPAALTLLAGKPAVKESAGAAEVVAWALANIAGSDAGKAACVTAGAPAALTLLAGKPAVAGSAGAVVSVARALADIAGSDSGVAAAGPDSVAEGASGDAAVSGVGGKHGRRDTATEPLEAQGSASKRLRHE